MTIQAEPTEVIARVLAPRVEEEPPVAEGAEGEAAAEGARPLPRAARPSARATAPSG